MTERQIARSLILAAFSSLSTLGFMPVAFGQTLPLESPLSPSPSVPSSSTPQQPVAAPSLMVPPLPGLGEFSRYEPQDSTVYLLLKLGDRKVYVYQGPKLLASYPVAIGRPEFPTPTGEFKVFQMIVNPAWQSPWTGEVEAPGPDGSLGLRWIGFFEMSNGVIGFHGTPNVASIGRAVSHGCVRMRNEDIVKLYELIKLGTLVRVEP
jgi:hypothetical protein